MAKLEKRDKASVSLDGLSLERALQALLAIPDPAAKKPKPQKAKSLKSSDKDEAVGS